MDSGATHALRPPLDQMEWEQASQVNVALAGDARTVMKQNRQGTLLSGDEVTQMIVPMGKVISRLGYRLHWTPSCCELLDDDGGSIPLKVVDGCPEVDPATAHILISKLEASQLPSLKEATMESLNVLNQVTTSWWACLCEYVSTGEIMAGREALSKAPFFRDAEELQVELLIRHPRESAWDCMKEIALNRRTRKRLLRAATWVVRWDPPGYYRPSDALIQLGRLTDVVYVNVGSMMNMGDFTKVWKVLVWAAINGRIGALLSHDVAATPAEFAVYKKHRNRFQFLHALAAAGQAQRGGCIPKFLVERRKFRTADDPGIAWVDDGHAQLCLDEMGIHNPMVAEDEIMEVVSGLFGVFRTDGSGRIKLSRMSADAAWRLHVMRNHQPFRRDCAICVRNAATGRRHRSTLHPSGYVLSVDVAGPLRGHGRSPDGKFFKYFVIGAFRIPKADGVEVHREVRGHPIPDDWNEEEPEETLSDDEVEVPEEEEEVELPPVGEERRAKEEWEKLKATFKEPLETETLYYCVPVRNKKAATMLPAIQQMVVDIKALGYPVVRVHADRGGEFRGNLVRKWILSQGMLPTTSTGSEPAENGVAEAGVRFLKRRSRARILLDAAGLPREHWPTAIQTAAAQQRCERLGLVPPMPVAYGAKVYVKIKKYKTGDIEDLGPHWLQGKYQGPATDIRGGHVILKSTGTFIQTTHVRVARDPPPLDTVAPTILVEPESPPPMPPPPTAPGSTTTCVGGTEELPPYPKGPPISYAPPMTRATTKTPGVRLRTMKVDEWGSNEPDELDALQARSAGSEEREEDAPQMCGLQPHQTSEVEMIARRLCEKGRYDRKGCVEILEELDKVKCNLRTPRAIEGQGILMGAYVQGPFHGITMNAKALPWTTRYLNAYLLQQLEKSYPGRRPTWSTIVLHHVNEAKVHKDVHNEKGTTNYIMELPMEMKSGLWLEEGKECASTLARGEQQLYELRDGSQTSAEGRLVDVSRHPAGFDPKRRHAWVKDDGRKWILSAYTPSGLHRLARGDLGFLRDHGFPLKDPQASESFGCSTMKTLSVSETLETTPLSEASSSGPECMAQSGARVVGEEEEEASAIWEDVEYVGDWEVFVDEEAEHENDSEIGLPDPPLLRRVCGSDDPGGELEYLRRCYMNHLEWDEVPDEVGEDMASRMETWWSQERDPRLAKIEPEYTPNIEDLIRNLQEPLRHTHNVSPAEVRLNPEKWLASIRKELHVVEKGFRRLGPDEAKKYEGDPNVQKLPAKMVYTLKPPAVENQEADGEEKWCKRKSRIVCCGNFADDSPQDVFASGAAAESMRCTLVYSMYRKWITGSLDITGAFMLTPMPTGPDQVRYLITPPAILVQLGLVQPGEKWLLTHGMYGLRQSPKLWATYRDKTMKDMVFESEDRQWRLHQGTAEPNIWFIYEAGSSILDPPDGTILVYVDDLLICAPLALLAATASKIGSVWKTSPLEVMTRDRGIRFLGCEIELAGDGHGLYLHQRPYVMELLRSHGIPEHHKSPIPCSRELLTFAAEEGEDPGTESELRQAQRLCGELLWIAQRSRPDISFSVAAMGSLLTKAAPRCIVIGKKLLAYLQATKNYALSIQDTGPGLTAWSDSSFAPTGERSHSGIVITWRGTVVGWRSSRQPFVCLSTAECELMASIEALVMAMSMQAVTSQFEKEDSKIGLKVDNKAAIVLASPASSASWRTRHLRARASYLKEKIEADQVALEFVPGKLQLADLLTKGFPRQRLQELVGLWGIVDRVVRTAETSLARMVVLMMMVQTCRAKQVKEPTPLDTSLELYIVAALAGVALVAAWEGLWWIWYRLFDRHDSSRQARRLRRLQQAVEMELHHQMNNRVREERPDEPTCRTIGVQADLAMVRLMPQEPMTRIEIREVEVPVPGVPSGPFYLTDGGHHVHMYDHCWGLRSATNVQQRMMCRVCREGRGRSLRGAHTG